MEVFALVGPSGTGKSHRAISVAYQHNIDAIVDDGLLITGSEVLAGKSAKRQPTKIGAIRTALFSDENHALEARQSINNLRPSKILILGTSEGMVNKIASRLELTSPNHYIYINDIASSEEIQWALNTRKMYGKHIVPAPTVAVKPRLSGALIEPIRTLLKGKHPYYPYQDSKHWVEQSVVHPTFNFFGKFYIANNVLTQIITNAAESIDQVHKVIKVHIQTHDHGVEFSIDLVFNLEPGLHLIAELVQQTIVNTVEHMTALHVAAVDLHIKKLKI